MIGRVCIFSIMVMALLSLAPCNETKKIVTVQSEECYFCDDHQLTTKEKCEELLWKSLIDEKNWLDDGIITKEVYELQIEPFNKALNYLELGTATDEEIEEIYTQLLLANLDWIEEEKAVGEEIDEDFYTYINSEIEKRNITY